MSTKALITLQWKTAKGRSWHTYTITGVPVSRPVKIRIEAMQQTLRAEVALLVKAISKIVKSVGGTWHSGGPNPLIEPATHEESLMETIVCDGTTPFPLDDRVEGLLARSLYDHAWVLPAMPRGSSPEKVLPEGLQRQNVVFWQRSPEELALTILGRAGITSLDRRVFISYRRSETEPMAGQLFDALTKLNYSVFLDTVSVEKGVDFQNSLFEQLADKSMVVLLHSKTFSTSEWTMAEVNYARQHDLSALVYQLPDIHRLPRDEKKKDPLVAMDRWGTVFHVSEEHLGSGASAAPWELNVAGLEAMIGQITEYHDKEMIRRLGELRKRTLSALKHAGRGVRALKFKESPVGAAIHVSSPKGEWSLFPSSRPPGVPELHEASQLRRGDGRKRVVVGHVNSFHPMRKSQLDWVVDGRDVAYLDVHNLDVWLQRHVL